MVKYEVWDAGSGNIVDWFDTFLDAVRFVRLWDEPDFIISARDEDGFIATYTHNGEKISETRTLSESVIPEDSNWKEKGSTT